MNGYKSYYDKPLSFLIKEELENTNSETLATRRAKKRLRMYANLFTRGLRKKMITEESFCLKCSSQENLVLDHIVPIAKEGKNIVDNIQVLCQKCNRQKSDKNG